MKRIETPVLIVGAGPTGLTAGLLLSRLGIGHRIVERRAGPQCAPAAHVVNARTFEIWRQAGVDLQTLWTAARDPKDAGSVYWVTRLGGDVLGQLPYERQGEDVLALTPTPLRNLSQHRLEPLLLAALAGTGGPPDYRQEWESAEYGAEGVTSHVRDLDTAESRRIDSRYLIAADGVGSPIRQALGIRLVGLERIQAFIMIHFAANLRALVGDCPGILYWVSDPSCMGTFVAHDIDQEWVFMHAWDPERESFEHYDPARCESIVRRAMVPGDVPLTIRTVSPWAMSAQTAERYRQAGVFLAGDSAHCFPPTGGLGLNTGVQDVHNLTWKIAAVERGWANGRLLDTYEQERQPVARSNAEQSLLNAVRLLEVPRAIGFSEDPDVSRQLFESMLVDGARRRAVEAVIHQQAEHFDMLGLQLGYSYEAGALVADGTARPAVANPVREFAPTSRPGSRLPHGWVESRGHRVSTLDLIALDRFTLLVGPRGGAWCRAANELSAPMQSFQIGRDVADPANWWSCPAEMEADGALLVRPDQHVAFRAQRGVADPRATLARALRHAVGEESFESALA